MPARSAPGAAGATPTSPERNRAPTLALAVAVAAAYAGWASGTTPFTTPADVAVSIPSAVLFAGLLARWLAPAGGPWRPLPAVPEAAEPGGHRATLVPWLALLALLVAVELASYFHGGPRSLYPTISSSVEEIFRYRPVKAAAFFGWLAGGWYLVKR